MKKTFLLITLLSAMALAACATTTEPITEPQTDGGEAPAGGPQQPTMTPEGDDQLPPPPGMGSGPTLVSSVSWSWIPS